MIYIKDFPEGTKLNILYTAPITEYYNEKLPSTYISTSGFYPYIVGEIIPQGAALNCPFFFDKIDYSEVEFLSFASAIGHYPLLLTDNVVFNLPKIKKMRFQNYELNVSAITLNCGEDFEYMTEKPSFNSSKYGIFRLNSNSKKLQTVANVKVDYTTEFHFNCDCENLKSSPYQSIYSNQTYLTFHSGFPNCKYSQTGNYYNYMPNLTYESCISILNNLYDFVGNGVTPNSSQGKLKVHSNFLTTVGDELSIATSRGWTITA